MSTSNAAAAQKMAVTDRDDSISLMGDDRSDADALNGNGEDTDAESGAGYGNHAPQPEPDEAG